MFMYSKHLLNTPQTEAIPGMDMVENNESGYVFEISPMKKMIRFLILGSEGGTYYAKESKLTVENAKNIIELIKTHGKDVVDTIVEVSEEGRAPKNDAAIFALALACTFGDAETKKKAYNAISRVCRIGTHLFQFMQEITNLRGFSRGLRRGISNFYTKKTTEQLAYQLVKYRQRNGWTHKDVLRLSHVKPFDSKMNNLLRFAVDKSYDWSSDSIPQIIVAFIEVQYSLEENPERVIELIRDFNLPREAIPTSLLNDVNIWEALLENMPLNALIRNLGKMTNLGMFESNLSYNTKWVIHLLSNSDSIVASKLHPMSILIALRTYANGKGEKGKLSWTPNQAILDALNNAFYASFRNVTPTGKNIMLGLDVSGSMFGSTISGTSLSAAEATAAIALVTSQIEPHTEILAFSDKLLKVEFHNNARLDLVLKDIQKIPFGGTDCSLPILYALQQNIMVDAFVILTDSETYSGDIHPVQALKQYRDTINKNAKMIVIGMTSNGFSIANPNDRNMLDVVGFDVATPEIISSFIRDEF